MKLDPTRLQHLRQIATNRKATFRAASDDRHDQREKLQRLERDRSQHVASFGTREAEALEKLDARIASARAELSAMQERCGELAAASSTAGQTFERALEHARETGLDLPDDLKERAYALQGAVAEATRLGTEAAT